MGRRLTNEEVTRQAEAYEAKLRKRMDREEAEGAVFFKGPVDITTEELKIDPEGRLVLIKWSPGGDGGGSENDCYVLRRLESYDFGRRKFSITGEFHNRHSPNLYNVKEGEGRVARKTLTFRLPLDNEDVLRRFLDEASMRSSSVEPTTVSDRATQYVDEEIAPIGRSLMFLAKVPGLVAKSATYRTLDGSLLGFVEIGGKHYPEYTFTLDGVEVRRIDRDAALEDLVDGDMAASMLRGRFPRDVTVRVSRRDRDDSHCIYF